MFIRLLYSIIIAILLTSHSAKAQDYQLPCVSGDIPGTPAYFSRSVFSVGINSFLKDIFNTPSYIQDFLPNNFFHMIEFLHHGNHTGKDSLYVKSVIRLFSNKAKASTYINAYAMSDLLAQLPALLEQHFIISVDKSFDSLKDIIYEIQYQTFSQNFPEFKADHETFLKSLSQQIENAAELRKLITIFLEVSLSKLVWNPQDQFDTWQTTKLIADQLTALHRRTIITDLEDLNSLFITLLERYCFFLDLTSDHLAISTFEKIKEDIHIYPTSLLALAEQEQSLETKMQRFTRCLADLEAKARAREAGLIV